MYWNEYILLNMLHVLKIIQVLTMFNQAFVMTI